MTGEALTDELEKLKLDYEQTNETFRMLADIRFKLLAFVPTISGVGVTLAAQATDHETGLALGLIGLVVTLGIIIYELRNTQIYDATVHRAKWLEVSLGMRLCTKNMKAGGLFNERPARAKLVANIPLWHDLGLALVYAAAVGGWIYLIVESLSALVGYPGYAVSLLTAVALAGLFAWGFLRLGRGDRPQPTDTLRKQLGQAK